MGFMANYPWRCRKCSRSTEVYMGDMELFHGLRPIISCAKQWQDTSCDLYSSYSMHKTVHSDVIMSTMASQITSLTIVYSTVYSGADQRKHQSSASLTFVRGIHRWPVNSPHKGPVMRKMFPFDDVIMQTSLKTSHKQWAVKHFNPSSDYVLAQ